MYTAHIDFIERFLLNQTRFFRPSNALEVFDVRMSSSVSSLFLLAAVELRYLSLFTWVRT